MKNCSFRFAIVGIFTYCVREGVALTNNNNSFQFPWQSLNGGLFSSSRSSVRNPQDIKEQQIKLSHGISAEVLSCLPQPKRSPKKPTLIFLHGSFHASWCWAENFFPYFVQLGYPVVAFSWRGTGGTFAGEGVKKVKASEHCQDLQAILDEFPKIVGNEYANQKPIVISHSFGGIVLMKFLEESKIKASDVFSGIVPICSVPPSGNGKMTMRFLRRSLIDSWKITAGFAMKKCIQDASLCRTLFFGGQPIVKEEADGTSVIVDDFGVTDADIERYQEYFARDTDATIDLIDLAKKLPSNNSDKEGRAPFVKDLPPCLVVGAEDDFIVDQEGNLETAKYFGLNEAVYVDSPHDVMLGRKWQNCADTIHDWIQEKCLV